MIIHSARAVFFSDYLRGVGIALSIAVGYVPVAITFALIAANAGVSVVPGTAMSLMVFAGAAQFMAVALVSAGVPIGQIILATFLLNFRHLLFAATMARRVAAGDALIARAAAAGVGADADAADDARGARRRSRPLLRTVMAFAVTDEVFSVVSTIDPVSDATVLGIGAGAHLAWVGGTVAGFLLGDLIPASLQIAMATALYALFAGVLVVQVRAAVSRAVPALAAAAIHSVLVRFTALAAGWAFVSALIGGVVVAAALLRDRVDPIDRRTRPGSDS